LEAVVGKPSVCPYSDIAALRYRIAATGKGSGFLARSARSQSPCSNGVLPCLVSGHLPSESAWQRQCRRLNMGNNESQPPHPHLQMWAFRRVHTKCLACVTRLTTKTQRMESLVAYWMPSMYSPSGMALRGAARLTTGWSAYQGGSVAASPSSFSPKWGSAATSLASDSCAGMHASGLGALDPSALLYMGTCRV